MHVAVVVVYLAAPDQRSFRCHLSSLLRPRCKWPSGRTAEQRNEITPFHACRLGRDHTLVCASCIVHHSKFGCRLAAMGHLGHSRRPAVSGPPQERTFISTCPIATARIPPAGRRRPA